MTTGKIEMPRGSIITTNGGKAQLVWNTNFVEKWHKRYSAAQIFVDSEVLRHCEPYIPMQTGMLIKSGILGTTIGSGMVKWIAPYARRQYYKGRQPGTSVFGALRGRLWFDRMKASWGATIIRGARKLAGGGQ
jgi:Minor capsid protein